MGHVLSAPVTKKESGNGRALEKGLSWGHSAMQGWRVSMEDAHLSLGELPSQDWRHVALFGVMDGHGGEHVAHFCEKYLPPEICKWSPQDIGGALISAFHRMDVMLTEPNRLQELQTFANPSFMPGKAADPDRVGCTACVCCVTANALVVANCGDSRAVLCRNGQAVPLSEDHKPNAPIERQRISKAGGTIERSAYGTVVQFRVNGNLNLSRSIGDMEYKKNPDLQPHEQMICATPDVQVFMRETGDDFFVIACDGVWDVMGSQDVVDFVRDRLPDANRDNLNLPPDPKVLSAIMEDLLDNCISPDLAKTGGLGGDNMTALVVVLGKGGHISRGVSQEALLIQQANDIYPPPVMDEKIIIPNGLCGCKADLHPDVRL
jgi:protein phosphatase 1G